MTDRAFWEHRVTGQIWAVETDNDLPVRCNGPLAARDLDPRLLTYLEYSTKYLYLLKAEWASYGLHGVCSVCGLAFRRGAATVTNGAQERVHLKCSLAPPNDATSAGAAVLVESLWQTSARLRYLSRDLRGASGRRLARSHAARARYPLLAMS